MSHRNSRDHREVAEDDGLKVRRREADELVQLRRRYLNSALSTSYDEPLKIVRGEGAYLFDESGRAFLDCVNNVCHVGHCHPRVVAAGQRQMAVLNTNTRYLHDNIVELAERALATFPPSLNVCIFVNSGSEANDLALRMARTHTGKHGVVVIDHAYHGNTQALVEISPYKFNGSGGNGPPATTKVVEVPDRYRGIYRGTETEVAQRYASDAIEVIDGLRGTEQEVAAFVAESILGVGGQIPLPAGYLSTVYDSVRRAGGVCIADEVQVGFGRVGTDMWAFQGQRVVPDIVTLGKPMGNGHPLAAVITTREVAASFDNGMEYFNTFGGNPVSCAIGLSVLDVINDEGLQRRAKDLGEYLIDGLRGIQQSHSIVGDIRGKGLFVGIEFVRDHETLEPAQAEAHSVVQQMRHRGFLLSTDGPYDNVIKIKPPMVIEATDVEQLLEGFDRVIGGMRSSSFS